MNGDELLALIKESATKCLTHRGPIIASSDPYWLRSPIACAKTLLEKGARDESLLEIARVMVTIAPDASDKDIARAFDKKYNLTAAASPWAKFIP